MLQQDEPQDFVVATGRAHSVRDFCEAAFGCVQLDWRDFVKVDEKLFRPAEVDRLVGDAAKAQRILGWKPGVSFSELVNMMVDQEIYRVKNKLSPYATASSA